MATLTTEERPAQLVIDLGVDGVLKASASYREVILNEDGSVRSFEHSRTVTLEKAGDDFPWNDFMAEATKAALLNSEATDQLRVDLTATQETVTQKDEQLVQEKATIADREALIVSARNSLANVLNTTVSALAAVDMAIKARQPPPAKAPTEAPPI